MMKAKNANPMIPNIMKITMFPTIYKSKCTFHSLFQKCLSLLILYKIKGLINKFGHKQLYIINLSLNINLVQLLLALFLFNKTRQNMGQNHSNTQQPQKIPQAISKNLSFKNHQDYQFVKQIHRINVPSNNVFQFKNKKDNKFYTLRIIIVSMDDQISGLQNIIQKRKKIKSLHLCQLKLSINQQETLTCATIHKLGLLIQCPPKSLKQQFQERKTAIKQRKISFFKESQLWAITYSVVHGLKQLSSHGIHHQSLDIQQIYIDTNGLIKLGDPILFGLQKNYIAALRQKQFCARKLSPQLINFLQECNFFFYDKEKSDIFIFGLILLEITLLKQITVYNCATKQKKFGVLNSYLLQAKNKHSQKFHRLLCWMLQIQPKNRPSITDLEQFIQTNNVETLSSNDQSKHLMSNHISPIASQIQFKQLPIYSERALQNRTNKQVFIASNNQTLNYPENYQKNDYKNHNFHTPQVNSFYNSSIKQVNLATTFNNTKTASEHSSDVIFPFQLVYNRIVNNNQNLKPFELPKLYQQYKVQMFNSSCRGSVPSSSFHSKNLQKSNQNIKQRDIQTFSQKYGHQTHNVIKNSKHALNDSGNQYLQDARDKQDNNLIYSNSSGLNATNRIFSSTKTLGDIKLIQSNHYINDYHPYQIKNNKATQMQGIIEQSVASSPYRKLNSQISKSIFPNQSGNNTNTIFSSLKLPEYENKTQDKKSRQNIDLQYKYKQQYTNLKQKSKKKVLQQLQFQYHSLETKKEMHNKCHIETFKSQFLLKQTKNQSQFNQSRQLQQSAQIYRDQKEFFQIKQQRFSNFQKFNMLSFKDQVITSKNQLFDQSQMNSKLSVFTPNFYQKERSKNSYDFLQNSKMQELQYVQRQVSLQGNIYTGTKTKDGLKQGEGKLEFHDGGYYNGQWKNNQMNGYGEMYYQNGSIAYKGSWKNDHFCGSGKVHNDRPQYFTDQFNYRDFSQIGQKWLSYQGEFDSDSKHGKGRIDLTNGQYFEGTFDYDMIEGYGTYYTKDQNKIIRGVWRDNQLIETI